MNSQTALSYFKTKNVLYVEDDTIIREAMKDSLEYYFDHVFAVGSYEEAINIYHNEEINMLLSDIELPGKSGIDLVKMIRKDKREMPIIMMTAYSDSKYLMELISQNLQSYLVKPITLEKLEKALYDYLQFINPDSSIEIFIKGQVRYVPKDGIISYEGNNIQLTSREKMLVNLLLKHKNHYVPYSEIENEVWYPNVMTQSALKSMIYHLRKKFPIDCIKTYAKEGYILQCD